MLLDVNVLLALTWEQHIHHEAAHEHFSGLDEWSTCPVTESGLIRLLMTERIVGRRVSGGEALAHLDAIRRVQGWNFLADTVSLADPVIDTRVLMGRRQVTDLHLVSIAASHGTTLATFDAGIRSWLVPRDQHWITLWNG